MASPVLTVNARYQISGKPIGQGGMGLVYKAYDTVTRRYVALKTMKGALNTAALELFSKEWTVLARLSHPNIVDILDTGELEEGGERRPFFVMPFLPGVTLDQLIRKTSQRLTVERIVDIISQACRGLQAAHEQGLIHRDLKPSNIFVMEDDTVKVIDFGVVHLAGVDSVAGLKGTIQYMAPEQIDMKPTSTAADIFSLSVLCYEALTARKPFARRTEAETAQAVRRHIPPPASELNPLVPQMVSRVVHKGMAKEPWHRFSTAREYGEALQKALNNQPIERFDRAKLQPRIERAKKAQTEGDLQFASEILTELEAEGNIDPEMSLLRIQIDHAIRQKSIRQLIDSARTRLEEEEFPLAMQKIQEVLAIDPENPDALSLRGVVEKQRSARQLDNWFRLVEQHVHNRAFAQARHGLEEVLKIDPANARACELMLDVDRREQEISRLWAEKDQLYQSALSAYQHGEISSALTKLERILAVTRESPDSVLPDRDAQYQSLYNQIRTEREAARNSYAEGRHHLADRNFGKALEICIEYLNKAPGDPMFQALKLEIEEQQRQDQSSFIAEVSRRAEAESDLDRRVEILKEAAERCPNEAHFQQSLRLTRERRDLVNSIVAKARQYEERLQCNEALSQWDILRNIYPQYPGLEFEVERVARRRDEQVEREAKARWVEQIDRQIASGDHLRARDLARTALSEFRDDRELVGLEKLAQQSLERSAEAEVWLQRGQQLCFDRQYGEGLEALRKASTLDNRNPVVRAALLNALLEQARSVLGQDWRAAEPLIQQALTIDGSHPLAKNLQGLILDYKHQEIVTECISAAREMQASDNLPGAIAKVEEVLAVHPNEVRLIQLRATLRALHTASGGAGQPQAQANTGTTPDAPLVRYPSGGMAGRAAPLEPGSPGAFTETVDASMIRGAAGAAGTNAPTPVVPADQNQLEPAAAPQPPAPARQSTFLANIRRQAGRLAAFLQGLTVAKGSLSPLQWILIGLGPTIVALAFLKTPNRPSTVPAPAPEVMVSLVSNVLNAQFEVDRNKLDQALVKLKPGTHIAKAYLPGYKTVEKTFTIQPNARNFPPVEFRLEPEPISFRFTSDLKPAQVSLDDRPRDLPDTGDLEESFATGVEHKMTLRQGSKELLSFSFVAEPGRLVTISNATAGDVNAIVIGSAGNRAQVYCWNRSLRAGLKGDPLQPIPQEGLAVDLSRGSELVLESGSDQQSIPLELSAVPHLNVVTRGDLSKVLATIEINVPDSRVMITGRRPQVSKTGRMQVPLRPGHYVVRVEREGYYPEEQPLDVAKGGESPKVSVTMRAVEQFGTLVIDGATPGADVLIDGQPFAQIGADGTLERRDIPPGAHAIIFRKNHYEDRVLPAKNFGPTQPVKLTKADAEQVAWGRIRFGLTPANAVVTYRRSDETTAQRAENGTEIYVKPGHYLLSATLTGWGEKRDEATIEPGRPHTFDGTLPPDKAPEPKVNVPATPPPAESAFTNRSQWTEENGWWVHKGPSLGLLRNEGIYRIEISRPGKRSALGGLISKKKVEWSIDAKDDNNRLQYTLDESGTVERKARVNGNNSDLPKKKLSAGTSDIFQIEILRDRITVVSGEFKDSFPRANPAAALGAFGFKGDVAIKLIQYPGNSSR